MIQWAEKKELKTRHMLCDCLLAAIQVRTMSRLKIQVLCIIPLSALIDALLFQFHNKIDLRITDLHQGSNLSLLWTKNTQM